MLNPVPVRYCCPQCKRAAEKRRRGRVRERAIRRHGPGCRAKKHAFQSPAKARQALIAIQNKSPGVVRSFYKCLNPLCPYWHLSSRPPTRDDGERVIHV